MHGIAMVKEFRLGYGAGSSLANLCLVPEASQTGVNGRQGGTLKVSH